MPGMSLVVKIDETELEVLAMLTIHGGAGDGKTVTHAIPPPEGEKIADYVSDIITILENCQRNGTGRIIEDS